MRSDPDESLPALSPDRTRRHAETGATSEPGRTTRVRRGGQDEFELPECDARSLDQLTDAGMGHDALVHLAWNTASENFGHDNIYFDNASMAFNAYRASEQASVRRVVVASSVHADVTSRPAEGL